MNRHVYHLEIFDEEKWVHLFGLVGKQWGLGYLECRRYTCGPRRPMRLVRDDGKVIDDAHGLNSVTFGIIAGMPSSDMYERAAAEALEKAAIIRKWEEGRFRDDNP